MNINDTAAVDDIVDIEINASIRQIILERDTARAQVERLRVQLAGKHCIIKSWQNFCQRLAERLGCMGTDAEVEDAVQSLQAERDTARAQVERLRELVQTGDDLLSIVDGAFGFWWVCANTRLTDTSQWRAFYVALNKALADTAPAAPTHAQGVGT